METFGDRIRAARHKAGLSQEALGERLGITRAAMNQIENGTRRDTAATLLRDLAVALGVSADYLVGHTPRRRKKEQ